jgi:CRP/FNR family cyclic AMP-dependent transcriptional regulator
MPADPELFPTLSSADLQLIADHGLVRTYPRNTVLVTEGDSTDSFYIILSGKVKVFLSDERGREVLLNIQGPGEYFGELALIDEAPRSASIQTLKPTQLAIVSRAGFRNCLADHPQIAVELISALVHRVRTLTENVRSLALMDVYGRVARTLLSLATPTDRREESVIEERLTHQDIANMVGASREMVSRIMKDLTTGGYVEVKDHKMIIREKLPPAW